MYSYVVFSSTPDRTAIGWDWLNPKDLWALIGSRRERSGNELFYLFVFFFFFAHTIRMMTMIITMGEMGGYLVYWGAEGEVDSWWWWWGGCCITGWTSCRGGGVRVGGWEIRRGSPPPSSPSQSEVHINGGLSWQRNVFLFFFNVGHEVTSCSLCRVSELPVLTLFLVLRLHW